jgi:beta-N-acetylhexosaminidase
MNNNTNKHHNNKFKPIVLDVAGLTLEQKDIERIIHPLVGGVILFGRNFDSRMQLTKLCTEIKQYSPNIVIFIDHEGGRVQRCKSDGFTHLPAMGKLGQLYAKEEWQGLQASKACGYVLASELRACGIDFSYTPVLDLDYGNSSIIGDRAFEQNPHLTAILASNLIDGLNLAGMPNCGKHFPGHGFVAADSHIDIPVDERSFDEIWRSDIVPYMFLMDKLDSIMPAHVIYSSVDKHPAGFSSFWLQDILRNKLGFNGIIFSDDLAMEGASVAGNVVQGAIAALDAGCDMVLICNRTDMADELLHGLSYDDKYANNSKQSANRLHKIQAKKFDLNWQQLQKHAQYISAKQLLKSLNLIN